MGLHQARQTVRQKSNSTRWQVADRVHGFALAPNFEVQLDAVSIRTAHFRNFLAAPHRLVFLDQQCLVVRIGGQKGVVVLQNNEIAIAPQTGARIHHPPVSRRKNRVSGFTGNIVALVTGLIKTCQQSARSRPDERNVVFR